MTKEFRIDWSDWGICIRFWTRGYCRGFILQIGPILLNIHNA